MVNQESLNPQIGDKELTWPWIKTGFGRRITFTVKLYNMKISILIYKDDQLYHQT